MARKTIGTNLYTIDPDTNEVLKVGCVTSISGIDTKVDQLETTCLEDAARTYVGGMATPGSAQFDINFDPSDASHVRLHELKVAGTTLPWALGFGDGTEAPTVVSSDGSFELPESRSWIAFEGYMNSYPFEFALNSLVKSNIGIQISGEPSIVKKVVSSS